MIAQLLSVLFPPRLPGHVRDWTLRFDPSVDEQGSAGPARPKQFRDGIERYFAYESEFWKRLIGS